MLTLEAEADLGLTGVFGQQMTRSGNLPESMLERLGTSAQRSKAMTDGHRQLDIERERTLGAASDGWTGKRTRYASASPYRTPLRAHGGCASPRSWSQAS